MIAKTDTGYQHSNNTLSQAIKGKTMPDFFNDVL